ncbi:ABC transporter permease [Paralimibaculum aggregatum]|uniref:ABC transporter permease n=1 Tax=Paralimibaculum aggregatum TaxID=3036245 RepID=A0ABQ6LDZ7_9RHOB|nr:ABC transporter permease [Limibaculum sp. NKW23]GMG81585.1 ABC transporter permease [Limibaculum sp. NKW23]
MDLSDRARRRIALAAWVVVLFLLLPGFVTLPVALNDSRFMQLPQGSLSLRHFEALLTDSGWHQSFLDSFTIALAAMAIACAFGTFCALGVWRLGGRIAAVVLVIAMTPMILPPVVSALAMYRVWVQLDLYDSWAGVVIAHAIIALPYVVTTVSTSLALLDARLEQAARSLGATPWRAAIDVLLPNIRGGVISGAVFAFIISWDEIVVTLFISTRAVYTLPRRMWDGIRENVDPTVAAVAVVLMAITILGVAIVMIHSRLRRARPKG